MRQLMKILALAILCVIPAFMMAQEVASLTGTVTDTTGAVVQGVKVTLLNTRTNAKYEATSNEMGQYTISKVLPGPGYKLTFERDGFEKLAVNDLYLIVGATRTQNAQLKVGAIAETMEVSATSEGVALNTSDATVGSNFSMNTVAQLPVQFRDSPTALMQLQPGVVGGNVTGGSDGIGSRSGAVTGARGDQNNVTLDGLDVNDFATGQAFSTVANAPVDSIQEFRGETAGSLAASGRGSGAQVQMVTKSGTNQFHGSLYEFHRNTATAANSWFNNQSGIKKPALLRNFFGASIGGPVVKDKLFFFFNYQGRRDARSANAAATVPLDSFRNGNVSYIKATNGTTACNFTSRQNTTPGCIGTLTSAQIAAMDPQGVGIDNALLQFINDRYPHANDLTGGDGVNTGYFRYTTPVSRVSNDYVTRIDYNMNNSMKLFGRFSILRDEYGDSVNYAAPVRFPGDPLTKSIRNTSYAYVLGHTWTISPTVVNQFTYGETVSRLDFPTGYNPNGTTYWQIGGSMLSNPYYNQSEQGRRNPIPVFRNDLTWQKGNHNIQIGGTFKPIKTESYLNNDNNFVTLGLGGLTSQLNASLRPTDLRGGSTASTTYDRAFALMLGRFASVGSNYNHDSSLQALPQGTGARRSYRYWETEAYLQDTWKVTTDLTLTYGVRYQYYSVPYEVNGIEAVQNLGFDELLAVRNSAGLAGVSGNTVVPITYYDLGGKANGARGLYEPNLTNFAPRFSFAYSPKAGDSWLGRVFGDKKTVLRGGAGVVYDHPVANALNFIQDQNSYMFQSASSRLFGAASANTALLNDPRFTAMGSFPTPAPAPTIARPFAPFVTSAGVPNGTINNEFNYAIDPGLKTPYSILFNVGFQRELPHHFVLEASYVGRLGRRLIAQADASQLVDFKDTTSGQLMSAAFANLTGQVRGGTALDANGNFVGTPVPWFENQIFPGGTAIMAEYLGSYLDIGDIADSVQWMAANGLVDSNIGLAAQFAGNTYITNKASSNYHGLLMSLHKNMSNGLQFDLNYTFSHSIDNASGISNSIAAGDGMGFICDARNLRICRGNSDFDVTHMINGNFIYELPFGKGKTFASSANGVLDRIIGGWSLSGIPTWRTGIAFTPVTGAYLMGYANNAPAIFNGDRNAIAVDVHQESDGSVYLFKDKDAAQKAFTSPYGFTMGSRNILRGPRFFNLDLGIAKNIPINERFKLQFRADSFNSLNHPSFALPGGGGTGSNADVNGGTFGQITGTSSTAREMQFSLRLEF